MATFVSDSFTSTDGTDLNARTGETGATWARSGGTSGAPSVIQTNRARGNHTADTLYYASGSPATAEYDVQADVFIHSHLNTGGIAGRINTAALTGYLVVWEGTGPRLALYKVVAGAYTLLGSYTHGLSTGAAHATKLEIRDAAKKAYLAGVERISSADNAIAAAGKAGVFFFAVGGATTGYHPDNFTAADPGGGGDTNARLIGSDLFHGGLLFGRLVQ